jgi:iron complex transport system permease protein
MKGENQLANRLKIKSVFLPVLILIPLVLIVASLFVGRYAVSFEAVIETLLHPASSAPETYSVVWQLRLPRSLASAFVGASLAVSGAAFQGVFKNPLVNSGLLGVSNGAGFGAALAIVLFGAGAPTYAFAFFFAVLAVVLSYMSGRIYGTTTNVMLILGGVVVSGFFAALTSIMKYIADAYTQLPAITFWLMGSFANVGVIHLVAAIPMAVGMAVILLCRWKINVLSMGDREAAALGVNIRLYKGLVIAGATLSTASAVCISGVIGWVGLVIPHICRMLIGNDNDKLIPMSISFGAAFLVIIDTAARNLWSAEIPIGILTAVIGTPFFVYLLRKTKGGGWQ